MISDLPMVLPTVWKATPMLYSDAVLIRLTSQPTSPQALHPKGNAGAQQEWSALPCRQGALPLPSTRPRQEPHDKPRDATHDCEEPQAMPREEPHATPREEPQATPPEEPQAKPREQPQAMPQEEPWQDHQLVSHGSGRWIVSVITTLKVFSHVRPSPPEEHQDAPRLEPPSYGMRGAPSNDTRGALSYGTRGAPSYATRSSKLRHERSPKLRHERSPKLCHKRSPKLCQ